jgi:hypothetical protein
MGLGAVGAEGTDALRAHSKPQPHYFLYFWCLLRSVYTCCLLFNDSVLGELVLALYVVFVVAFIWNHSKRRRLLGG